MVRDISGKRAEYYEAVLQLRDCGGEAVSFAEEKIREEGIHVAKTKKVPGGIDYYLADKNFVKSLGKKLHDKFGGDYKMTASLWGRKEGKDIYRLTVLFRGMSFRKGDKVIYKGEEYEVKLIGKDILLQKVQTGEKAHVRYKEMEKIKKKEI